jgi:hypothetical protein
MDAAALVAGSDTQIQFNDGGVFGADSGLTYNKTTDTLSIAGDLAVDGGDMTSSAATFNLVNSGVTSLNLGGAATAIEIGAATGTTSINNNLFVEAGVVATRPLGEDDLPADEPAVASVFTPVPVVLSEPPKRACNVPSLMMAPDAPCLEKLVLPAKKSVSLI